MGRGVGVGGGGGCAKCGGVVPSVGARVVRGGVPEFLLNKCNYSLASLPIFNVIDS